jgi:hypothetical protein
VGLPSRAHNIYENTMIACIQVIALLYKYNGMNFMRLVGGSDFLI